MKRLKHIYFNFYPTDVSHFNYIRYGISDPSVIRGIIKNGFLGMSKKKATSKRDRLHFIESMNPWIEKGYFDKPIAGLTAASVNTLSISRGFFFEMDRGRLRMAEPELDIQRMTNPLERRSSVFVIWSENTQGHTLAEIEFNGITSEFEELLNNSINDFGAYLKTSILRSEFASISPFPNEVYDYLDSLGTVYCYLVIRDHAGYVPNIFKDRGLRSPKEPYTELGNGILTH